MLDKPAKLVLIESIFQGQAGLVLEPPLIVYKKNECVHEGGVLLV